MGRVWVKRIRPPLRSPQVACPEGTHLRTHPCTEPRIHAQTTAARRGLGVRLVEVQREVPVVHLPDFRGVRALPELRVRDLGPARRAWTTRTHAEPGTERRRVTRESNCM